MIGCVNASRTLAVLSWKVPNSNNDLKRPRGVTIVQPKIGGPIENMIWQILLLVLTNYAPPYLKQILPGCITLGKKKKQQLYSLKSLKTKHAGLLLKMNGSSNLWDLDTDENDDNRNAG